MAAPADLVKATALLLRLVRGMELMLEESGEDGIEPAEAWTAYEDARRFLGSPVVLLPGGSLGEHYHGITFDPNRETCYWCDCYADEQAAAG